LSTERQSAECKKPLLHGHLRYYRQTMGLRGMPEGELVFENLQVPASMAVLPPSGFSRGFADLMNAYNSQRVGAGTVATGIAAGALDHALEWAKTREQFGRKIGEFQGLQ
jgi:butyryl-CoA dehydrogenase